MLFEAVAPEPSDGGVHKGAISQSSGLGRAFKGLGVAKRYCSRDSIGNTFVRWGQ